MITAHWPAACVDHETGSVTFRIGLGQAGLGQGQRAHQLSV
jgi:hypothetical protein